MAVNPGSKEISRSNSVYKIQYSGLKSRTKKLTALRGPDEHMFSLFIQG